MFHGEVFLLEAYLLKLEQATLLLEVVALLMYTSNCPLLCQNEIVQGHGHILEERCPCAKVRNLCPCSGGYSYF